MSDAFDGCEKISINRSPESDTNLTPNKYLEEMRREVKIINIEVEKDNATEEATAVNLKSEKIVGKEIDWEERADRTSLHTNTVSTRDMAPAKIIKSADKMVEALKQH